MTMTAERVQELHFVEPLPGFDGQDSYTLSPIDPDGMLFSLRSVGNPDVRFVLTPASVFFADFDPSRVGSMDPVLGSDEVDVLLMLTLRTGLADATANLRAPIVVAMSTGRAVQVILDDATLPMNQPLLAA